MPLNISFTNIEKNVFLFTKVTVYYKNTPIKE
jgi:hypothetical protein